jgi:hypothetical protein
VSSQTSTIAGCPSSLRSGLQRIQTTAGCPETSAAVSRALAGTLRLEAVITALPQAVSYFPGQVIMQLVVISPSPFTICLNLTSFQLTVTRSPSTHTVAVLPSSAKSSVSTSLPE